MEITNQSKASLLLVLRYATAILAVMSCFFVCQSVTSQCSIKTFGPIELFLLWWLPMMSPKYVVRNFLILAVHNILSDSVLARSLCIADVNSTVKEN